MRCRTFCRFLRRITPLMLVLAFVFAPAAGHSPFRAAMASGAVETATGYPYTTYTYEAVNLREKQSAHSEKLLVIPEGAKVTVYKNSGTWSAVEYRGVMGYVKNEYIAIKIPGGTVWRGADETGPDGSRRPPEQTL